MIEYGVGATLAIMLLVVEHYTLWQVRLTRIWRYALGVFALGCGISLSLFLRGLQTDILGIWFIIVTGGAFVAVLHKIRELRDEEPGEIEGAFLSGKIVTRAREGQRRGTPGE